MPSAYFPGAPCRQHLAALRLRRLLSEARRSRAWSGLVWSGLAPLLYVHGDECSMHTIFPHSSTRAR